jgi:hypothetical protein
MHSLRTSVLLFLLAVLTVLSCGGTLGVKLPVVKDTGLWYYRGKPHIDFGATEPLFIEGAHNAALLGFDTKAAQGKKIERATLWLHQAGDQPLVTLVVSTIAADWIEGSGDGSGSDPDGSCAAWVRIDPESSDTVRWAGPQSDVTDVMMTAGNTLRAELTVVQGSDGWQSVELPLDIAHALASGESYGLVLVDGKGQMHHPDGRFINKYFNTHGGGRYTPYLEVELSDPPAGVTPASAEVTVESSLSKATLAGGGAKIFVVPASGADNTAEYYEVRTSSTPLDDSSVEDAPEVPRYLVPRAGSARDSVSMTGLEPGGELYVALRTVDRYGRTGQWTFASGRASDALEAPVMADPRRPDIGGAIRVWAVAVDEKVNPVSGRLLEDNPSRYGLAGDGDYDYMYDSYIWDASARKITLDVPRGGTAAFQVVVSPSKESISGVSLRANWNSQPAGAGRFPVKVFRNWYVRSAKDGQWYPEVAVPLKGNFAVPDADNGIEGQRNQSFTVEFYAPRAARAGRYSGQVVVGARGLLARRITVEVNVHEATIPERLPFISEMNSYGPVGEQYGLANDSEEYFDIEEQYYRIAHEHLTVINQLSTRQNGSVTPGGAPELEGEGAEMRISDWSAWDRRWSRYLDGSAFEGMDREVPVPVMYLPFFENWPANLKKYYRFTPDDTSYIDMINEHALEAPSIEEAFDPAYEQEWKTVMAQFTDHIAERGWTETEFQVYLNNKYYWKRKDRTFTGEGSSWWLLDEPYHWEDFKAVGWYGELFQRALGERTEPKVVFRIDVSRPHLAFGLWDKLNSVYYVSAHFYIKNAFLRHRAEKFGEQIRNYGSFHSIEQTNLTATAWPLKAWLNGGNGLLPWQTMAKDNNFEEFRSTAIFYPGVRFGIQGPVVSLRLKAMREGTELVTLLSILAEREGWTLQQAALVVGERLNLGGATITEFFDDAGRVDFSQLASSDIAALKRDILTTLDR